MNILQGRKDVKGFECFVIQEVLRLNVLNIARWKQNQETSLFYVRVIFTKLPTWNNNFEKLGMKYHLMYIVLTCAFVAAAPWSND